MALFKVVNNQAQLDAGQAASTDVYGAGIRFTQDGAARTTRFAGTAFNQGIPMSPTGQVAIVDATSGLPVDAIYLNGLPISGNKVCVSLNASSVISNGLPFDSNGVLVGSLPGFSTLALDFTGSTTLDPRVTFSRTSNATLTDSNGRVAYAPHNLLTNSEDFEASAWVKTLATVTANSAVAPDGTTTADKLIGTAVNSTHSTNQTAGSTVVGILSFYAKAAEETVVSGWLAGASVGASFNLSTGVASGNGATAWGMDPVGNGWYRCYVYSTTATSTAHIYLRTGGAFLGNGTDGLFIWGAQLNVANAPVNLLTFSEQFDDAVWTRLNTTVTANTVIAPNGTLTADSVFESSDTVVTNHGIYRASSLDFTAGTTYTTSAYVKNRSGSRSFRLDFPSAAFSGGPSAFFDLQSGAVLSGTGATITNVGDGWYRCSFTQTATSTASNRFLTFGLGSGTTRDYVGNGTDGVFLWGAQLNTGSTALPYVATTSSIYLPPSYNSTTPKNLLGFTQEFDVTTNAWTKVDATVTANATAAPDGYATADLFVALAGTGTSPRILTSNNVAGAIAPYVASFFVKNNTNSFIQIANSAGTAWHCNFDVSAGLVGTSNNCTGTINNIGSGWYRCSVAYTPTNTADVSARCYLVPSSSASRAQTWNPLGTESVYLWGAQLSNSASVDPYVYNPQAAPTSTAYYGPRFDYNPTTLAANGLLIEEQKSNLMLWSEDFSNAAWAPTNLTITSNSTTSPAGLVNAQRLTTTAATNTSVLQDAVVNATAATFSVYVKIGSGATDLSTFVLRNQTTTTNLLNIAFNYSTGAITYNTGSSGASATDVGNGWWRIVLTATSGITAGNTIRGYVGAAGGVQPAGVFIFAWGAQLEAGSFATSYIPTVASQVTRAADNASMLGDNFATWYRQDQGTLTSSWNVSNNVSATAIEVNDGSSSNRFNIQPNTGGTTRHLGFVSGVAQIIVDITGASTGVSKDAFAYAAGDFAASRNASAVATSSYAVLPTGINQLRIGSHLSATYLNGTIRSIGYYNVRLPNATLQTLTS